MSSACGTRLDSLISLDRPVSELTVERAGDMAQLVVSEAERGVGAFVLGCTDLDRRRLINHLKISTAYQRRQAQSSCPSGLPCDRNVSHDSERLLRFAEYPRPTRQGEAGRARSAESRMWLVPENADAAVIDPELPAVAGLAQDA
jgi:hypothetical protein